MYCYGIENQLLEFKRRLEKAIIEKGVEGKTSIIRSSGLINLIHDAVKYELIKNKVNLNNIKPALGERSPEIKLAGYFKQKDQDVCVIPSNMKKSPTQITWGPLAFENKIDPYGYEYSENTLVINVRSQITSLAKNTDTLFERTFAEALNLHMRYKNIVLGEVYLIPVYEYDDKSISKKEIKFKNNNINLEKYISFFSAISKRDINEEDNKYERCALLIVDFSKTVPKLYKNSQELKADKLISSSFPLEYADISFDNFVEDLLEVYEKRFCIENLRM